MQEFNEGCKKPEDKYILHIRQEASNNPEEEEFDDEGDDVFKFLYCDLALGLAIF